MREHTQALIDAGADVWVLGCTHFPFLLPALRRLAGPSVQFIDPAQAVARELARRLSQLEAKTPAGQGVEWFYTTGELGAAQQVMSQLWERPVNVLSL